jgi:hypothetical protein
MVKKKSPVRVNLSAKASATASAKLTAKVPTSSMGRLVDALTDIIRPFSEKRGLRADHIRLQREEVAIEIAKRAKVRAETKRAPIRAFLGARYALVAAQLAYIHARLPAFALSPISTSRRMSSPVMA